MAIKFLNTVQVDTDVLYVDTANNRVGIGTTSPTRALDVSNSSSTILANFKNTGGTSSFISLGNTSSTADQIRLGSNGTALTLSTNYAERMRIDSSGNVGIGVTSVDARLHITALASNGISNVKLESPGASKWAFGIPAGQTYFALDDVNDNLTTPKLVVLKTSGSVGIGTTSPRTKLHVSGLTGDDDPVLGSSTAPLFISNTANSYGLNVGVNNAGASWLQAQSNTSSIAYEMSLNPLGGNVGIGTTTPGYPLEVSGIIKTSTSFLGTTAIIQKVTALNTNGIQFTNNGGSEKMRITDTGDVGIGTTSPSAKLEISSTGNTAVRISTDGDAGDIPMLQLYRTSGAYGQVHYEADGGNSAGLHLTDFRNDANSHIIFNTQGDNERMRIEADGNVGIGTTSPGSKLDVAGNIRGTESLIVKDTGGTKSLSLLRELNYATINNGAETLNYNALTHIFLIGLAEKMRIASSGNVGIGTTSPGVKLDVNGQIRSNNEFLLQTGTTAIGSIRNQSGALDIRSDSTRDVSLGSVTSPQALFIEGSNGKVGIGTTSPSDKLVVQGDGDGILVRSNDFTLSRIIPRGQTSTNWDKALFSLYNAAAENVRIDTAGSSWFNGGNVGINDTTPSYKLDVNGEGRFTGDLRCLSLIQTSQSDKKEFISDIVKTTNKKIEFKEYVYKSDSGNRKRYGVLAEDIEVDYPELVHVDADGVKGVNYIDLLVKRVAELEKELEDISLTEGPKGDTGSRGLRGYTGTSGSSGTNGADGKDGNSHLSDVSSIGFNEKSGQLEIRIGRETYRFNQDK